MHGYTRPPHGGAVSALTAGRIAAAPRGTPPRTALTDTEAHKGALHGGLSPRAVDIHLTAQAIGGANARRLSALEIDLIPAFGGVSENRDSVVVDLEKAPADEERFIIVAFPLNAKLARLKDSDEGSVIGEDTEFTDDAGRNNRVNVGLREEEPLTGDDFETEFRHLFSLVVGGALFAGGPPES